MPWTILLISGVFEAVWAVSLAASNGFKRLVPSVLFVVALVVSMVGLAFAMRDIPTGTAYAVWTGVGAALTVIYSIARGWERAQPAKLGLLTLLIACVVGLKVVG